MRWGVIRTEIAKPTSGSEVGFDETKIFCSSVDEKLLGLICPHFMPQRYFCIDEKSVVK